MRIISWNVNGLRSLQKGNYWQWLIDDAADIFCLQEIKAESVQLSEDMRQPAGYHSYFNSSRMRKGYSGVATYSKQEPKEVHYDILPVEFNQEGRIIETKFSGFTLLNVYFPNGGGGPERLAYKLDFYDAFLEYIEKLRKYGESVIFTGDVNVAHTPLDIAEPERHRNHVGFLPEEREWMDQVVELGYIDTFRHFHPHTKDAYTYWDTYTRARDRNIGWRLDYFFVSPDLEHKILRSEILPNIYGSDHCPVLLEITV